MKIWVIGLAVVALALAWAGYRMDLQGSGPARVGSWVVGSLAVVAAVLGLLRRV